MKAITFTFAIIAVACITGVVYTQSPPSPQQAREITVAGKDMKQHAPFSAFAEAFASEQPPKARDEFLDRAMPVDKGQHPVLGRVLFEHVTTVHFSGVGFPANKDGTLGGWGRSNDKGTQEKMTIFEKYIVKEVLLSDDTMYREIRPYDTLGRIEQQISISKKAISQMSSPNEGWMPPEKPDPSTILKEAGDDTRARRYETALAKHVWFHQNALSIERSQYGVRLSYALSDWQDLAKDYPPALAKLKEFRDRAQSDVMEGKNIHESFHDMASINRTLGEDSLTKDLFEVLDAKDLKAAKKVFGIAKDALVREKAYSLYVKYADPKSEYTRIKMSYQRNRTLAEDPRFGERLLNHANKTFAKDVATLVAILVLKNRKKEAQEIAESARAESEDSALHDAIEQALKGIVPNP